MPLQATSGAASYDGFGGGVAAVPNYIEDVFSTYLWTTAQPTTIVNGIDLATKGGMVWTKLRNSADNNRIWDSARGPTKRLITDSTAAQVDEGIYGAVFNTNGFTDRWFGSGYNATSWTFRKQPKFFDVQTFTYPLSGSITVNHSLGSTPGCIFVKATDGADNWYVYHRMMNNGTNPSNYYMLLNTTGAQVNNFASWITVGSTSITFPSGALNPGSNFVMYLFAHNAGGFGLTGTDNVISCGSFTQASGGTTVNLGYEPQLVMVKCSSAAGHWFIFDNMRGNTATLYPNLSNAEVDQGAGSFQYNATGFTMADYITGSVGSTLIYIAIRRGPMKVPTSGTSVFSPVARTGTSTATTVTTGFPVDFIMSKGRNPSVGLGENWGEFDRLRGLAVLSSNNTGTEFTSPTYQLGIADFANNTGMNLSASDNDYGYINKSGYNYGTYFFRRAPSFMDEVCYTGNNNGTGQTLSHNLAAVPELMIVKRRGGVSNWLVYTAATGATNYLLLEDTAASAAASTVWQNTAPTATQFTIGQSINQASTYVAYLFATCAGVSKCGTFTGNGSSQTINCGFTGGARFVMIKATSTTGDWMVADSARGIVSGNDPYLELNNTNAEVTGEDWLDTDSTGFVVNQVSASNANTNGVTYIYLAIA